MRDEVMGLTGPMRAAVVLVVVSVGMVGCGESQDDGLWNQARGIWEPQKGVIEQADEQTRRQTHGMIATAIDRALDEHPDADPDLRQVYTDLRDESQQLAEGAVTGEDAEAMRERHAEYWDHLIDGELPPDYR